MEGDASFGRWLQRRRKALDLTQDALAARVGCSVATIRKIETDARRPSRQIAEIFAEVLAIAPGERAAFLQVARGERRTERLASVPPPTDGLAERPTPAPPSRLPIPLTPLIGRAVELAEVGHLLTRAECRLLTIVGPGGMGKTRLAIAAAAEQGDAFPDGIFFVSLARLNAPEFIAPSIAEAIGFAFFGIIEPKTQLLNYVREKEMLIVLDNVEQLLDGAGLLSELLQYASAVKLLVTSRERLQLQGEWVVDLQGLPVPPPPSRMVEISTIARGQGRAEVETYGAVTLFVTSAQRARMGFALSEQNRVDVARVCQLVEGLPLGIELAATWVSTLSCQEIAQQIERNIDFLAVSIRDLPERHRSIRAVFDHSWKLLTLEERQVLQRLSVFRGGFTRQAAEQVAGATLGVLSALVAKSLLHRLADGRYDVHDLVRQYVGRQLAEIPPDHDATYTRFSHYYADWLQRQEASLFSAAQRATLDIVTTEIDNVRAALHWAATHQEWASLDQALDTLFWFFMMRNRYEEAITMLEQWIAALRQVDAQAAGLADYQIVLGHALTVLGWHCVRFGQLGRAREASEYSLGLLRAHNAPHVLADALQVAGTLHFQTGDYAQCEQCLLESLHLQRTLGRDVRVAQCQFFLSYASLAQGRLADARVHVGAALRLLNVTGETWATIRCQALLTTIVRAQGDLPEAERLARQTLALSRTVNDPWPEAQALLELGVLARLQGQPTEAQRQLHASIALFRELGERWSVARALNHLGDATYALGDDTEAHRCFLEGFRTAMAAQALPVALDTLVGIAAVRVREGGAESALELLTQILLHPSSSSEAQDRAERLRVEAVAQLTPQQIEVAQARVQAKTFEAVVAEILSAQ